MLVCVLGGMLRGVAAAVAACALASPATAAVTADARGGAARVSAADALERDVLAHVNAFRARHGLAALRVNDRLSAAADVQSTAMAQLGFFAHRSADGSSYRRRVGRFYGRRGFDRWSVGENLLWQSPDLDGPSALVIWQNSRRHRRVLLTPRWREIGLSAVHVPAAPGFFRGREVTIVTADFGVRG
jgi:uncharacterized protein YkwD